MRGVIPALGAISSIWHGGMHRFKFHSHAEFWLLTELYRETRMHTVFEVKKAIKEKLLPWYNG